MSQLKKFFCTILLCLSLICLCIPTPAVSVKASDFSFIILSKYKATLDIGEELYIIAITSTGKKATWKSSDTKVASVNTYGKVIAKKSGTVTITAKTSKAEASCKITINKTKITLDKSSASLERGDTLKLSAKTSNGSPITWKSSKKSVATIDVTGVVTCLKPGETIITATADNTSVNCKITVKSPTIRLSKTKITLFRGQKVTLTATVSSNVKPTWKTNKKSVAVVDSNGTITAQKHGIATITATVDGVSKTCEIVVEQPTIKLSATELIIEKGENTTITANVSSGNQVKWSTSNPNIATIDSKGTITGLQKGNCYIYASEDGVKMRCTIKVTN